MIELKYAHDADLEKVCREALEQIEKKRYTEQLYEDGMEIIIKYGIACHKKGCRVMAGAL